MKTTMAAGLFVAALFTTPAQATTGLQWQWEGQERTYELLGEVQLARFIWLRAQNNKDVRVGKFHFEVVLTCKSVGALGKKAFEVGCTIDDFALQAAAVKADAGMLGPVLTEWDDRLTGKTISFQHTIDGRVRSVGFSDVTRVNRRDGENLEVLRQVLSRGLAAFDMRMPKKGDDGGDGQWVQKGPMAMGFTSDKGSVGSASITHAITETNGTLLTLTNAGEGVMGDASSTKTVAGDEVITDYFDMRMAGEAVFDVSKGHLVSRQYQVAGEPTASSDLSAGFGGFKYVQAVSLRQLDPNATRPKLSKSIEQEAL